MVEQKFSGKIETAYGKTLKSAIPYDGTFEAYEDVDELRKAGAFPNDKEVLDFVNSELKAKARIARVTEVLKANGYDKPEKDDPQVVLRNMIKQLILAKKTPEQARQLAENMLGYALAE